MAVEANKQDKTFKVPHVYVILLVLIAIGVVLSYIVPAGQYEMMEAANGREVVDSTSFSYVENQPLGIFDFLQSVPKGMTETATIIFFIFIVGGSFAVIDDTGAIEAGLGRITKTMAGKERAIVPIVMIAFSLGGAVFGMAEETLPFIPIMVTLAVALGFDSLTGAGMVLLGAGAGFAGAFMNPFTVGVAQGIAELPLFSGMGYRIIVYLVMLTVSVTFVYWYAGKVRRNPESSLMYHEDQAREDEIDLDDLKVFNTQRKLVLWIVAGTIALLVFGVTQYGWYIMELSALFLGMAIVAGLVGGLGLDGFAKSLAAGMANIAGGALVVGFARGILVVLNEGQIMHTILYAASNLVSGLPTSFAALGMYIFQCFLNFLIPSGSGQAAVSIPILAPLGDIVGVTRQTAVLAYQLGDGISNIFTPTSGYFMAGLALAKIPWTKWAKWFLPLIAIQYIVGGILVVIAHNIGFGPF